MHLNFPNIFQFIDCFDKNLIKKKTKNLGIIYRNYSRPINEINLLNFKKFCKKNYFKLYLANNAKLAITYKLDGVYFPSFNKKSKINKNYLAKNFKILGSAHNTIEINNKIKQGCELIFISPLFKKKKNKQFFRYT